MTNKRKWLLSAIWAASVGCGDGGDGRGGAAGGIVLSATESTGEADEGSTTGEDPGVSVPSTGPSADTNCDGGDQPQQGDYDFSLIWIANSTEGTVSKIDTVSGEELARYRTGPEGADPDPSRTSVSLDGDVAVVNRTGSVLKVISDVDRCEDVDADGSVRTSSGAGNVLPFGEDDCVAWVRELPFTPNLENANGNTNTFGPRPVAWEGRRNTETCVGPPARLWVGWYGGTEQPDGHFARLDGATGETEDDVVIQDVTSGQVGPYGGAVDAQNNFWVAVQPDRVVRIDGVSLAHEVYVLPEPGIYGIAIDKRGRPWVTGFLNNGIFVLEEGAQTFRSIGSAANGGEDSSLRGIAIDREGRGWAAANGPCRLISFDAESLTLTNANVEVPGCAGLVGVAVDADGDVWAVDIAANAAFKVDAVTHSILLTVDGLVGPYTYSDMTGSGLSTVFLPEG